MTKSQALKATVKRWTAVAEALERGDVEGARGRTNGRCLLCVAYEAQCEICPAGSPTLRFYDQRLNICLVGLDVIDWLDGYLWDIRTRSPRVVARIVRRALKALEEAGSDS